MFSALTHKAAVAALVLFIASSSWAKKPLEVNETLKSEAGATSVAEPSTQVRVPTGDQLVSKLPTLAEIRTKANEAQTLVAPLSENPKLNNVSFGFVKEYGVCRTTLSYEFVYYDRKNHTRINLEYVPNPAKNCLLEPEISKVTQSAVGKDIDLAAVNTDPADALKIIQSQYPKFEWNGLVQFGPTVYYFMGGCGQDEPFHPFGFDAATGKPKVSAAVDDVCK